MASTQHLLLYLIMSMAPLSSEGLRSFFASRGGGGERREGGRGRSTTTTRQLELAPANATVSAGVALTMGCVARTAVSLCQWTFTPANGLERKVAEFSPLGGGDRGKKERNPGGWMADQDCSYKVDPVEVRHSGRWVCAVHPLYYSEERGEEGMFLMSKPAFLEVIDVASSTTTTTTTTTSTTTSVTRPTSSTSSSSSSSSSAHFLIERKSDSVLVTWNLEDFAGQGLSNCVWRSPGRVRISSKRSLSKSVWISPESSTCGIVLKVPSEDDRSLSGNWTVVAEFSSKRSSITSSVILDPRTPKTMRRGKQDEDNKTYSIDNAQNTEDDWLSTSHSPFLLIAIAFCAIVIVLTVIAAILFCKFCRRKGGKGEGQKKEDQKKKGDHFVPPCFTATTTNAMMPISTFVRNPDYYQINSSTLESVQSRDLPEAPKCQITNNYPSTRISAIDNNSRQIENRWSLQEDRYLLGCQSPQTSPVSPEVNYSYILPRTTTTTAAQPPTYVTIVPKSNRNNNNNNNKIVVVDDQYELVSKPYENDLEFTTFGFSTLKRLKDEGNRRRRSSNDNGSSEGDSGVDSKNGSVII